MWGVFRSLIVAVIYLMSVPANAQTERRVALVIGNNDYTYISHLANAADDARLIADTLKEPGFTLVGLGPQLNLDKPQLATAIRNFGREAKGATAALFYYAGHGVQVRGTNWLVPTTANPAAESDVDFEMVEADLVLRQMDAAGAKFKLVILDACRNNPFAARGLRAVASGLGEMITPEGTLISYATQPGQVARDGIDGHSPFTKALAEALRKPGLDVFNLFNEVGLIVKRLTHGAQQPWVSSSPLDGVFYFRPLRMKAPPSDTPPPVSVEETKLNLDHQPATASPVPLHSPSVPAPVAPEPQPVSSVTAPATREPQPYMPQFYVGKAPDAYCGPWVPDERCGWHNSFQQQPPPSALLSPPPR